MTTTVSDSAEIQEGKILLAVNEVLPEGLSTSIEPMAHAILDVGRSVGPSYIYIRLYLPAKVLAGRLFSKTVGKYFPTSNEITVVDNTWRKQLQRMRVSTSSWKA